jgi:ABC-2 type transport system ATP-binding protein
MGMRQRLGVAACLIGDPELLILDEPMNGLDPAGMREMRQMIGELVSEGRTVVLSSHLLDEVQRTCDAVAIVDRGNVVRQGSIDELLAGTARSLEVDCSDPAAASSVLREIALVAGGVETTATGVAVSLPAGTGRDAIADINRRLVERGVDVFRLQEMQASLESWFLQVTSRLGEYE